MKLCKDCKHCRPTVDKFLWLKDIDYRWAKCASEDCIDLVSGGGGVYCKHQRETEGRCGYEGKNWEAK